MNHQALTNPITEDDIANYLANSPDFFQRHAELLASVHLALSLIHISEPTRPY